MAGVVEVKSKEQFERVVSGLKTDGVAVVYFWAEFAAVMCKQIDSVVTLLAKENKDDPNVSFVRIDVEEDAVEDVTDLYSIDSVPAVVFLRGGQTKPVATVVGANAPEIVAQLNNLKAAAVPRASAGDTASGASGSTQDLNARLAKLVSAAPVMLFMKGSPDAARCKFSRKTVAVLKEQKVVYSYFDILTDNDVRQGLKTFSNWKTFPQLYIKGKLVGGLDVIQELIEEGEFKAMLPKGSSKDELNRKLKGLIESGKVMLFMKGSPAEPRCGFSGKIVGILNETKVPYKTFDILSDQEVRQGLKTYSNWPTFPQLYVDGSLVGGLDVVVELREEGELMDTLAGSSS